jgi:hypothetical protein
MDKSHYSLRISALLLAALALVPTGAEGARGSSAPEKIKLGQAVVRHVWPQGLFVTLEGKAGQAVTIQVTSQTQGGFDPSVRLLDPAGNEEASDDDSGGKGNCLIKDHVLKEDGDYRIFIEADDKKEGEVEILAQKGGGGASVRSASGGGRFASCRGRFASRCR